jgi:hypothetical protein
MSSSDKWIAAISAGLLFMLLASPFAYNLSYSLISQVGISESSRRGCPTVIGVGIHALLYALLIRLLLAYRGKCYSSGDKWTVSLMAGLMFFILSSPYLYKLEGELAAGAGLQLADFRGCPNISGLVANGAVFALISRMVMF